MSGDDSSLSLRAPVRETVFRPFPLASPSGALYIERMFLLRLCINQPIHYLRLYRSIYSNKAQQQRVRKRKLIAMAARAEKLTDNMPPHKVVHHLNTPLTFNRAQTLSLRRSRRSIWVWLFDFVVDAGTSLRMSRSRKECRHLAPDVSILERVSATGPGCIREGCMSCVVMSTYLSMSTYVSCAGMSRRTYGSCENCV